MGIYDYMIWKIPRHVGAQERLIQLPRSKMAWDITVCLFLYRLNHSILMPLLESYSSPIVDKIWSSLLKSKNWLYVLEIVKWV